MAELRKNAGRSVKNDVHTEDFELEQKVTAEFEKCTGNLCENK